MEYGVGEKFNQSTKQNETNKNEKKKKTFSLGWGIKLYASFGIVSFKKKKKSHWWECEKAESPL